jgi:hypothetical protein
MNDIVAFFSRCLLYTVFVVVSKVENTHVEFDMFERVVLTCLQICVLCAAWVTYECCAFIIRSVSRPAAYEHVLEGVGEAPEQTEDLLKGEKTETPAERVARARRKAWCFMRERHIYMSHLQLSSPTSVSLAPIPLIYSPDYCFQVALSEAQT